MQCKDIPFAPGRLKSKVALVHWKRHIANTIAAWLLRKLHLPSKHSQVCV
jgi:hypothetical protein